MEPETQEYGYNNIKRVGTGTTVENQDYKVISYPFGKYEVKVKLSPKNEFVDIIEIGTRKEFISQKQKASLKGYHDVDRFYIE